MSRNLTWTAIIATVAVAFGIGAYLLRHDGTNSEVSAAKTTPTQVAEAPNTAKASKAAESAENKRPEATSPANALIGLPVVASGGETVGQVLEVAKGPDTKTAGIVVKVTPDIGPAGTTVVINQDRFVVAGRSAQLSLSLDDVKQMLPR